MRIIVRLRCNFREGDTSEWDRAVKLADGDYEITAEKFYLLPLSITYSCFTITLLFPTTQ